MTKENAKRIVLELGLVYGIILGRWGIPRGRISRNQLSIILLNYIGAAVDILGKCKHFKTVSEALDPVYTSTDPNESVAILAQIGLPFTLDLLIRTHLGLLSRPGGNSKFSKQRGKTMSVNLGRLCCLPSYPLGL